MEQFAHISVEETQQKLDKQNAKLVDIRDEQSFAAGRIEDSVHLTNNSLQGFMAQTDFETPVIVCCFMVSVANKQPSF